MYSDANKTRKISLEWRHQRTIWDEDTIDKYGMDISLFLDICFYLYSYIGIIVTYTIYSFTLSTAGDIK